VKNQETRLKKVFGVCGLWFVVKPKSTNPYGYQICVIRAVRIFPKPQTPNSKLHTPNSKPQTTRFQCLPIAVGSEKKIIYIQNLRILEVLLREEPSRAYFRMLIYYIFNFYQSINFYQPITFL